MKYCDEPTASAMRTASSSLLSREKWRKQEYGVVVQGMKIGHVVLLKRCIKAYSETLEPREKAVERMKNLSAHAET